MKKERSMMASGFAKKLCCGIVAAAMALSLVGAPGVTAKAADTKATISLRNPRIVKDKNYYANQRVTYDCVYFGSYPQAEVVASVGDETTVSENIRNGKDYVVDSDLYAKLKSATDWDENGDVTVDGEKYRRINYKDATGVWSDEDYFIWGENADGSVDSGYHYFKYQPIKWRVLSANDGIAFLLADVALDCQQYNTREADTTWETSTIRSFLNSYDSSENQENIDYSGSGFLTAAFTAEEREVIENGTVVNDDNVTYGTEGGNNTTDRIFLLSENEAYGNYGPVYSDEGTVWRYNDFGYYGDAYGFIVPYYLDEAKKTKSSTYAKAMGCGSNVSDDFQTSGHCSWLLRSPGDVASSAMPIHPYGWGGNGVGEGMTVAVCASGIRPALKFNLASSNFLRIAKTFTTVKLYGVASDTAETKKHTHSYTAKVRQSATCTNEGIKTYICACGDSYTKVISKTAHTKSGWKVTKKATSKAAGQKTIKCTKCGKTIKTAKISKISSVKLSKTKCTYNGKAKKPTVTVKNSAGKVISASNYKVTYKNNKLPGKATVTVTFKGSYSGKVTKTFTINGLKQTITTARIKTYKASSLKKKAATIKLKAKTNGKGRLTYKVSKYPKNAKKYISVSKKGVVTLKKGAKKGTYKITITAAKTAKYAKTTKTVTIKVK